MNIKEKEKHGLKKYLLSFDDGEMIKECVCQPNLWDIPLKEICDSYYDFSLGIKRCRNCNHLKECHAI